MVGLGVESVPTGGVIIQWGGRKSVDEFVRSFRHVCGVVDSYSRFCEGIRGSDVQDRRIAGCV